MVRVLTEVPPPPPPGGENVPGVEVVEDSPGDTDDSLHHPEEAGLAQITPQLSLSPLSSHTWSVGMFLYLF